MSDKLRVDVEELEKINEFRGKINRTNLHDIEFYEKGKKIDIRKEAIEEWRFTGMANTDFVFFADELAADIEKRAEQNKHDEQL